MRNCTYVVRTVLCICMLTIAWVKPGIAQQIEKGIRVSTGEYLGFLEYKPVDYASKPTTKYPLIIFLHGIGERGNGTTELQKVTCCGIPRIIKRGHDMKFTWNGKTESFIVISPQSPKTYGMWGNHFIEGLINYAKTSLRVDPDRIFLTGLSMGGGGTFKYISTAAEQPKNLAAAATICAPCTFKEAKYPVDSNLPLWFFHAADDAIAPASCTESAYKKITALNPAVQPLKTIWPTGGHIVWDRVYTDTNYRYQGIVNIYEWFLAQNRKFAVNKLPVAKGNGTINISAASGVATLNGSASSDADGKIVRYVWKKIEGPAAGVITNPFGPNSSTTITGLTIPGTYKYELFVVDDRAAFTSDVVTVVVSSSASINNKIPIARAGVDRSITLPVNSVTLDGSASADEDGSITKYSWTKISGPAAIIASPAGAKTVISNMVEGTYVFKLKVTDNVGAVGEDQVTVVVKPEPVQPNIIPTARAGVNFSITLPASSIKLDGSASEDPDGTIKSYQWSKVSGPAASITSTTTASTTINNLVAGTYIFKLRVTDDDGAIGEDQITVVVNPEPVAPNKAPVANAGTDISITLPVNKTSLNGSGSKDSDGSIASYSWTKVSGPATYHIVNASIAITELNSLAEGTYQFKLKVTDNKGATAEDLVTIVVNPLANIAPVADAGTDIEITLPLNKTVLDGYNSSDADGTVDTYSWSKISGPSSYIIEDVTLVTTGLSNLEEGTYLFRLSITDSKGAKDSDTVKITVHPADPAVNIAPQAQAGANISITLPLDEVTLDGSASSDPDGTIEIYNWSFVSGPESFVLAEPGSNISKVSGLVEGTYSFRLEVIDNNGGSNADTVNIMVNKQDLPRANILPVAQAGDDITVVLPTDEVTLNGIASNDEDGTLTNYSWLKISGPSQFRIVSPSYHITKVQNLAQGNYSFRLQVKDNDGALGYDTINLTVLARPNVAPVSRAGIDKTIQLPVNEVELSGVESYDPDSTIVKYKWELVTGAEGAIISNNSSAGTIVSFTNHGEYLFRLTVTDNSGSAGSDVVKVTVLPQPPNAAPVANAGNDVEVQLPNPVIKFDGSSSYDPDGAIVSYDWVKVSGPGGATIANSSTANPSIVGVTAGEYVFRLTITDDDGQVATDLVQVIVKPATEIPNQEPSAFAGDDQSVSYPQSTITLDGALSADNDGTVTEYAWTLISGPSPATIVNATHPSTEVKELQTGEYVFELLVTDDKGAVDRDTVHISVINTMRYEEQMVAYPNPAVSSLNVQLTSDTMGMAKITVYNMAGTIVRSYSKQKLQAQLFESINVSNLQTGMYYVEVMVGGKLRKIAKFIKRQ